MDCANGIGPHHCNYLKGGAGNGRRTEKDFANSHESGKEEQLKRECKIIHELFTRRLRPKIKLSTVQRMVVDPMTGKGADGCSVGNAHC